MSLTVRDLCYLPSLSSAQVIAGHKGLDRPVDSVSVLEWMDLKSFQTQYFLQNEVVITSLFSFRDDVASQLLVLRRLRESGEVGMILYYVGLILPEVDARLIELADDLEFPIILMPPAQTHLRYSEAIREISEQIQRQREREPDFMHFILRRLADVPEIYRSLATVLRLLSDHLQRTLLLCDNQYGEYLIASWPRSLDLPARHLLDAYILDAENCCDGYRVLDCYPVRNTKWHESKLLVIAQEGSPPLRQEEIEQAARVLELSGKLWKSFEFDTYSADLIAAVINRDQNELTRLMRSRGEREFRFNTLWILAPRFSDADYKERSILLAEGLKTLRAQLQDRRVRNHTAILDEHITTILELPTEESLSLLKELGGSEFFTLQMTGMRGIADFHEAFRRAMDVMEMAIHVYAEVAPVCQYELAFLEDIRSCRERGEASLREAMKIIAPFLEGKERLEPLLETLSVYFIDCDSDPDRTAEKLFLHRNTVKYRLQKAQEILGFPLSHFPEALALYRALILQRLSDFWTK